MYISFGRSIGQYRENCALYLQHGSTAINEPSLEQGNVNTRILIGYILTYITFNIDIHRNIMEIEKAYRIYTGIST